MRIKTLCAVILILFVYALNVDAGTCTINTPAFTDTISSIISVTAGYNGGSYTLSFTCDEGTPYTSLVLASSERTALKNGSLQINLYFYRDAARTDQIKLGSMLISGAGIGTGSPVEKTIYSKYFGATPACVSSDGFYTCTEGVYTGTATFRVTY